jgi:predicted small lipoprotein YifL
VRLAVVLLALSALVACGRRPPLAPPSKDGAASDGAATTTTSDVDAELGAADAFVATDLAPETGRVEVTVVDAADAADAADVALFPSDAGALPAERYRALAVTAGSYHTCALLDDHRVKCWGNNGYGQLGTGDKNERRGAPEEMGDHLPTVELGTGRTAKAISAGRYATCAILDDGSVKCWGWSPQAFGRDRVSGDDTFIGDDPSELGDALPRVALGAGRTARLLAVGCYSACVVKDDESTHCWGSTIDARDLPPDPSRRVTRLVGASGGLAIFDDGVAQSLIESDVVPVPPRDAGRAVLVAGSRARACVLWANGQSRCGNDTNPWWPAALPPPVQAGGREVSYFFCGILADGHVVCPTARDAVWNDLSSSGGPFVRLGQPAVSLTSGALYHFCAALLNGEVKCWSADGSIPEAMGMGGSVPTATAWPSVDLGTRPAR